MCGARGGRAFFRVPLGADRTPKHTPATHPSTHPPAKNIILAGVKAVTLHDPRPATPRDAGANFYISPSDADGTTSRAAACRARLAELNTAVAVTVAAEAELTPDLIAAHSVVVVTDAPTAAAVAANTAARAAGTAFIRADTRGVFGCVFTDFGDAFVVDDVDGEDARTGIVAAVTPLPEAGTTLISCVDDERLEFEPGDVVAFSDMVGAGELVERGPWRVVAAKPTSFEIDAPPATLSPHVRGGHAAQVKQPKTLAFRPLDAALADPGDFLISDFAKLDRPPPPPPRVCVPRRLHRRNGAPARPLVCG